MALQTDLLGGTGVGGTTSQLGKKSVMTGAKHPAQRDCSFCSAGGGKSAVKWGWSCPSCSRQGPSALPGGAVGLLGGSWAGIPRVPHLPAPVFSFTTSRPRRGASGTTRCSSCPSTQTWATGTSTSTGAQSYLGYCGNCAGHAPL